MNGHGGRVLPLLLLALFLFALSAALGTLTGPRAYPPRVLALGALVSFIVFLVRARREILFLFVKARSVAEPGPATTWLLAAAVLLAGAALLERTTVRADATARGMNKLTRASREVIASRKGEIEIVGVFREGSTQRARGADLLDIYRAASPRVRTRMLDPDRSPEEARALGVTRTSVLIVRSGQGQETVDELTETAVTEAILRADNPRSLLGFTTGHGEPALDDGGPAGLGRFAAALEKNAYDRVAVRLFDADLPADLAALLVVSPRRDFLPGEIAKLHDYLERGGRVLICLEPGIDAGLDQMLGTRGIRLDSLSVYDESPATRDLGLGPRMVVVTDYGKHPIAEGGLGYAVFPFPRAIGLTDDPRWGIDAKIVARTGPGAQRLASGAQQPPTGGRGSAVPLAVAQEWEAPGIAPSSAGGPVSEKPYGRLLVVGDGDWLSGQFLDLFSNRDLALRSVHWLARREYLLSIPPMDVAGTPLRIGMGGMRALLYVLQGIVPLGLLGVGLRIWSRRR